MRYASLTGLDKKRLGRWLAVFFFALAVPTAMLIVQAYRELKWEAFHQYRLQAEALAARIDDRLMRLISTEQARPFTDYSFLNVAGDPSANFLQRSPLSTYPVADAIPGLIGYFQVDTQGTLSTPLLPQPASTPSDYGLSAEELQQRKQLAEHIQQILSENRLVQSTKADRGEGQDDKAKQEVGTADQPMLDNLASRSSQALVAEQALPQIAFDQLTEAPPQGLQNRQRPANTLGRVDELKLDYRYQDESGPVIPDQVIAKAGVVPEKRMRKERSVLPEPTAAFAIEESEPNVQQQPKIRIRTFESEIDPFEISLLDSGHFVLFRKVWRDGQRYIQGALIEQKPLLNALVKTTFNETSLSLMSDLVLAYQGSVLSVFSRQAEDSYLASADELQGALLLQTRLSVPFSELELIFSVKQLPTGPGAMLVAWVSAVLMLVLCVGFYLMYRLGVRQIELVRQQQDFVSAVSHELKTPLTSIRMYGEILREGWASEAKKQIYYDYIHDESERLSRLIANVLQLARMTRNDLQIDLKPIAVSSLLQMVQSKIASQIERAGFKLDLHCDKQAEQAVIAIDNDAFMQILINLVDNAIKFSSKAETKAIELGCHLQRNRALVFSVRDYGPGVPREQMKKVFQLFYRSENELTRETVGTGIGLALVQQLAQAMNGQVDLLNKTPGAEFRLTFAAW
jgi:signal transduction histidine kinase